MKLDDITNYIQSICENICTVLDVDVTVVSKDLIRIAGTGVFKDKIYEKISDHSAFSKVLKRTAVLWKSGMVSCRVSAGKSASICWKCPNDRAL